MRPNRPLLKTGPLSFAELMIPKNMLVAKIESPDNYQQHFMKKFFKHITFSYTLDYLVMKTMVMKICYFIVYVFILY